MRTPTHKYKGWLIERCFNMSGTFTHFEAKYEIVQMLDTLRSERINKPWHGQECVCEECTYTDEDHAHNRAIEDRCKSLISSRKVYTIKKPTLKACKQVIDEKEVPFGLPNE